MCRKKIIAIVIASAMLFSFTAIAEETEPNFDSMTMEEIKQGYLDLLRENTELKNGGATTSDSSEEIQELKTQIETLESEKAVLEAEVEALKNQEPETTVETELSTEVVGLEYSDATVVRMVQEALNGAGYDCGTPDGKAGEKTRNALTNYQTDHKLNVNGVITDELLESLNLAEKVDEAAKLEASKAQYSSDYSYEAISRNPGTYEGQKAKFSGTVLQVQEGDEQYYGTIRLGIDGSYNNVLYVLYDNTSMDSRILEDDYITVYGTLEGLMTYTAVRGNSVTIPKFKADFVELTY